MDNGSRERLTAIWRQKTVPVLYRRGEKGGQLLFGHVYTADAYLWLRTFGRRLPQWNQRLNCWHVPASWFNPLVAECIERFGSVYIIQPYRAEEKCAPACWHAEGDVCECSCMGANHGSGHPNGRWRIVSEAFATRWDERDLACRLLTRGTPAPI